ncbi:MAG: hypothetical protein AB7O32_13030 [Vicinamibacterales bacterium]
MAEPNTTSTASGTDARTTGGNSHAAGAYGGIVDRVRERAAAELSSQKDRAFDGLGTVAQAVRQSTQQLRDQQHDTIAAYVEQAADQLDRIARQLREKDLGELMDDAQRLAQSQPAVFIGSAFALGLIGARFIKSSSRRAQSEHRGGQPSRAYGEYRAPTATGPGASASAAGSSQRPGRGMGEPFPPASGAGGGFTGTSDITQAAGGTVGQGGRVEPTHDPKPGRSRRSSGNPERS